MPALTKRQKAMRRMTADREAKRRQRLLEAQNPDTRPDAVSDADAEADEDPDVKYMEASTQFDKPNGELVQEIVLPEETGTDNTGLPMHSTASNSVFTDILESSKAQTKEGTFGIEQFPYQRGVEEKRKTVEKATQRAKKAKEELKGAAAGCMPLTGGFLLRP